MVLRPNPPLGRRVLFLALALSAGLARAQPARSFELVWNAPATCPSRGEVEGEITRLVGDSARARAAVRAVAEVTRADDQSWRVRIRLQESDRESERSFEGTSCRAVTKVAALIIALTIEPNAGSAPEPAPPPPLEKPVAPPPSPRVAPATETPTRWVLAAGPTGELRLLPRLGVGFEVGLGIRLAMVSAEVRAAASLPQESTVASSSAGGRFFLATAGIRVCAPFLPGAAEVSACGGASVDRLDADGFGVTVPGFATPYLATLALGPRLDVRLAPATRLRFGAEATYTLTETTFVLDNVGNVHRTPHWGVAARLQWAWLF